MASKAVTERQRSAEAVLALSEAQAGTIGEALAGRLSAHLQEGEAMPDLALFVRLLGRALAAEMDSMVAADDAHTAELSDDAPVREERDAVTENTLAKLVELREILTGLYGSRLSSKVLGGPSPREPLAVERKAGEVASAIEGAELPEARVAGARIDPAALAAELRRSASSIAELRKEVATEAREAQATLAKKNEAIEAYNAGFGGTATVLEGLLALAGEADLAARVRPSRSRPGRREQEITEERSGGAADTEEEASAADS